MCCRGLPPSVLEAARQVGGTWRQRGRGRTFVATDTRRRTATSTRLQYRPLGVVDWLPPHTTCRSPFLEIEINRFQVGVDLIARIGYDAQRILKVVDQRAKAALSSG